MMPPHHGRQSSTPPPDNSDLSNSLSYDTVGNGLRAVPQGIEIRRWISEEMSRKISYVPDIFTCIEWDGSRNGLCAVPGGFHMVKFADYRTFSVMVVKGTARRPFPTNKFGCL